LPTIKSPVPLCCCPPGYLSFECHSRPARLPFVSNRTYEIVAENGAHGGLFSASSTAPRRTRVAVLTAYSYVPVGAVFGFVPIPRSGRLSRRSQNNALAAAPARLALARASPSIFCRASPPVSKTAPHLLFCSLRAQKRALFAFWQLSRSCLRAPYALSLSKMALHSILSTSSKNAFLSPL
jgi:hypothetical protein